MKKILLLLSFILLADIANGQIHDYNLRIEPTHDSDSVYALLTGTSGRFVGRGRFTSLPILAGLLEPFMDTTNTFATQHDLTLKATDIGLRTVQVTLSSADIMSMSVTPITLIAGVPGKIPFIVGCVFKFTVGDILFTGGGTPIITEETSGTTIMTGFFTQAQLLGAVSLLKTSSVPGGVLRVSGKGVMLSNTPVAFATGNGTITLYITYQTITL